MTLTQPDGAVEKVPLLTFVNRQFPPGSPMPEPTELFAEIAQINGDLGRAMLIGGLVLRCWAMANLYIEQRERTSPDTYRKIAGRQAEIRREAFKRFERGEHKEQIEKELAEQFETSVRVIREIIPKQPGGRPARKQPRKTK